MSVIIKTITGGAWTALTPVGTSGTVWVQNAPEQGQVVLNHADSGSGGLVVNDSFFLPESKNKPTGITADSPTDIFYARCSVPAATASVAVDTV